MGIRQKAFNDYISPTVSNCGMITKMEPSVLYPMSQVSSQKSRSIKKENNFDILISSLYLILQVDLNLRVNVDDVDQYIHTINGKKINVRGTLNAMGVRTWDMNINIDMSQEHTINNVKIQMTRETPGEKKLKVINETINNFIRDKLFK